MTGPDQSVNQLDYIQTLEDEIAREGKARRILTAMLAQTRRALDAYVERYGDITTPPMEPTPEPAPESAPEAPVG